MKQIILVMLMCGMCFGAYSSTPVTIVNGGYGVITAGNIVNNYANRTFVARQNPISRNCKITSIVVQANQVTGSQDANVVKIKLFGKSGDNYTLKKDKNITTQWVAAVSKNTSARTTLTIDLTGESGGGWTASKGDVIGTYFNTPANDRGGVLQVAAASYDASIVGDIVATEAISITSTGAGNNRLSLEAYTSESTNILFNENAVTDGTVTAIPYYLDNKQYIILEDVNVMASDTLALDLYYTVDKSATAVSVASGITLTEYQDAGSDDNKIVWGANKTTITLTGGGSREQKYKDLHIWIDTQNNVAQAWVYLKGGQSDVNHTSLCGRANITLGSSDKAGKIRAYKITKTNANTKAGKVIVCRNPVLLIGDSFASTYSTVTITSGVTSLNNVGSVLGAAFDSARYVINAGITGNRVYSDVAGGSTAIKTRWNGTGRDLIAYKDVLVVFLNGPGLNDIAPIGQCETYPVAYTRVNTVIGELARMYADTKNTGNDYIICGLMPYAYYTYVDTGNAAYQPFKDFAILKYNKALKTIAYSFNIPFVDAYSFGIGALYTDYTHPSTAGSTLYATSIATAYEQNKVPSLQASWLSK